MMKFNYPFKVYVLISLRLAIGWIFIWAFVDKLWGLGFPTPAEASWLTGVSPTAGFLTHGLSGPLSGWFSALSGLVIVDWLFMLGLLFVGLSVILGIMFRLGVIIGCLMMFLN